MIVLSLAMAMSAWCSDTKIIHPAFPSAASINVYYDDRVSAGYTLTSATLRSDGTYGVNVPVDVAVRSLRTAVNIINSEASADVPALVYVGPTTDPTSVPPGSIVVSSPPSSIFTSACGATAISCTFMSSSTLAPYILLKPTAASNLWRTDVGTPQQDLSAAVVRGVLSLYGLRDSRSPGGSYCPLSGATPYDEINTNGIDNPRSVMNGSDALFASRYLYRDDIEGLRDIWGLKTHSSSTSKVAADGAGPWTDATETPNFQDARTVISGTSASADSNDVFTAHAFPGLWDRVQLAARYGDSTVGEWNREAVDLAPSGATFARVGVAHGDGSVMLVWIDESDSSKDGANFGYPRVRFASKSTAAIDGEWTFGYVVDENGEELKPMRPLVSLGYNDTLDVYMLMVGGQWTSVQPHILYVDTSGAAVYPLISVSGVSDYSSFGHIECLSGVCSFPWVKNPNKVSPTVSFVRGNASTGGWTSQVVTAGGYIAYTSVDHVLVRPANTFVVSWQSLSGKTITHKRATISSSIDTAAELNVASNGPLALLYSSRPKGGQPSVAHVMKPDAYVEVAVDENGEHSHSPPEIEASIEDGLVTIQSSLRETPIEVTVAECFDNSLTSCVPVSTDGANVAPNYWVSSAPTQPNGAAYKYTVRYLDSTLIPASVVDNVNLMFDENGDQVSWMEWGCATGAFADCIPDANNDIAEIILDFQVIP